MRDSVSRSGGLSQMQIFERLRQPHHACLEKYTGVSSLFSAEQFSHIRRGVL